MMIPITLNISNILSDLLRRVAEINMQCVKIVSLTVGHEDPSKIDNRLCEDVINAETTLSKYFEDLQDFIEEFSVYHLGDPNDEYRNRANDCLNRLIVAQNNFTHHHQTYHYMSDAPEMKLQRIEDMQEKFNLRFELSTKLLHMLLSLEIIEGAMVLS